MESKKKMNTLLDKMEFDCQHCGQKTHNADMVCDVCKFLEDV